MRDEELKKIRINVDTIEFIFKASASFYYRQSYKGTNKELIETEKKIKNCLYSLLIKLSVAEQIIRTPRGFYTGSLWDSYQKELDKMSKLYGEKKDA